MSESMSDLGDNLSKLLTGDSGRDSGAPSSLYGLLALRQHRLNQAVGIKRVTPQVDLLLTAYDKAREREQAEDAEALARLAGKSFYLGVIEGAMNRIRQIREMVKADTEITEAQRLYREVLILEKEIEKAHEEINKV